MSSSIDIIFESLWLRRPALIIFVLFCLDVPFGLVVYYVVLNFRFFGI